MLLPFIECLILVGIHAYLGLHVIRRRVIFVDLALAQIAALGATVGIIFGLAEGSPAAFVYSLTFCIIGAAVFAFTRVRNDRVPQEAVIGLSYAITFALGILVVQKLEGVEHMESILVGGLLWVSWSDIAMTAVAYGLITMIHIVFRKQFLAISDDPEGAYERGMNVRFWDFLFYATFGIVITISVSVAGVLLVFVFLVAPAILSVMISRSLKTQLLVGWISGTVVTVVGLYLSYVLDLSCGPTVVAFYGVVLVLSAAMVAVVRAESRGRALAYVAAATLVIVGVGFGLVLEGKALASLGGSDVHVGHHHGHHHAAVTTEPAHEAQPAEEKSPDEILEPIREAIEAGKPADSDALFGLLADAETPPFFREEALALLRKIAGQDFGFNADLEPTANHAALKQIRQWLEDRPNQPTEPETRAAVFSSSG